MAKGGARGFLAVGIGSARDVLIATAIAGGAAYAINLAAAAVLGNSGYLPFAAFWSALYFIVGGLAGIQHETTRAARPAAPSTHPGTTARSVFLATAGVTVILLVATAFLWAPRVFGTDSWNLVPPLIVGALGYLAVSVAGGVLGGLGSWRLIAIISVADALLRLALVAIALMFTDNVVVLAWCVAVPFGLVGAASALVVTRKARGRYTIDARLKALAWNATRTVTSGAAMGVLITGLPALLKATWGQDDAATVSSIAFVSNLVRSPLIVLTMAFQVMMVQRLRDAERPGAAVTKLLAAIAAAGGLLTTIIALVGPWLLNAVFAGDYELSRGLMVVLVGSAVPSAALFVLGAALLARGAHGAYVTGWVLAAVAAVASLMWAPTLVSAVTGAVAVAPMLGLAVHGAALMRGHRRTALA